MTLREWLDTYTANGDAQLVCAWRKRAWRAMRPVVEQVVADPASWTASRLLKALDAAAYEAKIGTSGKRWRREYEVIEKAIKETCELWRAPTDDDRGVCLVAYDLVEQGQFAEAIALIEREAKNVLERPCSACPAPAGWCCQEISADEYLREDTPQTAAARAAGWKVWSKRSLIVPHESRLR